MCGVPDAVRRHEHYCHAIGLVPALLPLLVCANLGAQLPPDPEVVLATTTSVRDAGLLDSLLPTFEARTGFRVKVIAVGSGQAMSLGEHGEADILVLHDSAGEERFASQGFAISRDLLMRNEFVIVGPAADPARIRGETTVSALRRIAHSRSLFVSRADRSGTHVREQGLWVLVGALPERDRYRESGQGMSTTLQIASELQAYALTDIATVFSHKQRLDLEILVAGDPLLSNPYHILLPNPERFPWVNTIGAEALRQYLLSAEVQQLIGEFGRARYGRALFVPARGSAHWR